MEEVSLDKDTLYFVKYYKNNHKVISYTQKVISESDIMLDIREKDIQVFFVNENKAYIFETQNDEINICWSDGEYTYKITSFDSNYNVITLAKSVR